MSILTIANWLIVHVNRVSSGFLTRFILYYVEQIRGMRLNGEISNIRAIIVLSAQIKIR
jgi:hypothetical protein